jgi:hypothetical protein
MGHKDSEKYMLSLNGKYSHALRNNVSVNNRPPQIYSSGPIIL